MNETIRRILACPGCGGAVHDTLPGHAPGFRCEACDRTYPVADGVPRMMLTPVAAEPAAKSFGYQWSARDSGKFETETLYGMDRGEELRTFLNAVGLEAAELQGKVIVDAGCGDGELLSLLGEHGANAIGIDINTAIRIPHERCRKHPNVAVLQSDVTRPCIQRGSADIVWCEGVIVATSEPQKAFEALSALVKPGGRFYIWVYPSKPLSVYQRIRDWLGAPYRLPLPVLKGLSSVIALALYPLMHASGRKRSLRTLAFDVFDNLSPRYQWRYTEDEVRSMFRDAGFVDMRATGIVGMVGIRA